MVHNRTAPCVMLNGDPNDTTADPSSNPARSFWAFHNGCLFFDAYESQTGREMWKMCLEHTITYGL